MKKFALLFIATVFLAGCGSEDSSGSYDVQGVVFEQDGRTPIPNVVVEIKETFEMQRTNADGGFKFRDHPDFGYITIRFSSPRFDSTIELREVPEDIETVKMVLQYRRDLRQVTLVDLDYETFDQ